MHNHLLPAFAKMLDLEVFTPTMNQKTRKSIVENLKKLKNMNIQDKEKVISQFRKGWHESKHVYDPKEQEELRKEFNAICPELNL